jgi:L-ascorbate metabolism protein UlaG (beta-lactamase superfamily)
MTAHDAVELCGIVRPRVAIPVHYEGWSHFKQGRAAVERAFASGPAEVRAALRWLPIGTPADVPRPDVPVRGDGGTPVLGH